MISTRSTRLLLPLVLFSLLVVVGVSSAAPAQEHWAAKADAQLELRKAIDAYLDRRWLPPEEAASATKELCEKLQQAQCSIEEVERLVRQGRAEYEAPQFPGRTLHIEFQHGKEKKDHTCFDLPMVPIECEHVDYKTVFFLFLPKKYNPDKAWPLLIVGHGGNSAMSFDYAMKASLSGLLFWLPLAEEHGIIIAAPLSERGWGAIGNSIIFSTISLLQRRLNINPDQIYVTGHSMGGHLSWRSGIYLADRWGAVLPMSGGYDYVADKQVYPLVNVPGYATFGEKEPYNINTYNKKIREWMQAHSFDWRLVEKPGGHEIFPDELPKIVDFMFKHPRNLYRARAYGVANTNVEFNTAEKNEKWSCEHKWNPERPIPYSTFHWLRMYPLPPNLPQEKYPARVWAENLGGNRIRLTSQNARKVKLYLHPKMVDFNKPVEITANGQTVFSGTVAPDMKTLLEVVREFDDRGRIFYAALDVEIPGDAAEMPEPRGDLAPNAH